MAKPFETWTVFPHGPIEDGSLVVHNAIALSDDEMKELEAWGKPAWLIVPNGGHRMDSRIWKQRYPNLKVVAPPGAKTKVEEIVKVDETKPAFDDTVRYEVLDGTKEREGVLRVLGDGKSSLVFCDGIMNNRKLAGFGGFIASTWRTASP